MFSYLCIRTMLSYLLRIMESFDAVTMAYPIHGYFTNEEDYANFLLLSFSVTLMFYIIM